MPDYIKYMRKMIGNNPMFLVGAGTFVRNDKGEILLIKRTDNNTWSLPGGSCELGETFEEAAAREAFEECSITVKNLKLFNVFSGAKMHHIYPNGDEVYNAVCIFETTDFTGNPVIDGEESSDVAFFRTDNLPEEINPPDRIIINEYVKERP